MNSALHEPIDWEVFNPIATTVLYEGHVLYPYRRSALKNQQRWNFGTLFPPACSDEPSALRLEALIESYTPPAIELRLYFLFDDGSEHSAGAGTTALGEIQCELDWTLTAVEAGLWKLCAHAANRTPAAPGSSREALLALALHSAHLRCALSAGAFVSAQDPGRWQAAADECRSQGVYPVLVGPPGERRYLLAAPIILEDHARIAPLSRGDFCDATEIDELLTLRVLTLTDAEKAEARAAGGLARRILERCEAEAEPATLHGGLQAFEQWSAFAPPPTTVRIGGREARVGSRVRVRLAGHERRDIFEQALDGRTGVVQAIEQSLEGGLHLAIVADDDPGRDLGALRQTGHRFFFTPEELEPL